MARKLAVLVWLTLSGAAWAQPDVNMLRQVFVDALSRRQREFGPTDSRTVQATRDLGLFLREIGDIPAARRLLSDALRIDDTPPGASPRQTLEDAMALAQISPQAEAEPLYQRVAESTDPMVAGAALAALAAARKAAGDVTGEIELLRRALDKAMLVDKGDGQNVVIVLRELGLTVAPDEGITLLERAVAALQHQRGNHRAEIAATQTDLAGLLLAVGRTAEAEKIARDAFSAAEAESGSDAPGTATAAGALGRVLRAKGDNATAERLFRQALAIERKSPGVSRAQTLKDVMSLADILRATDRRREAAQLEQEFKAAVSH